MRAIYVAGATALVLMIAMLLVALLKGEQCASRRFSHFQTVHINGNQYNVPVYDCLPEPTLTNV